MSDGQHVETTEAGTSERAKSSKSGSTGLEPNVAAALAYVFAPLSGVLVLLLEGDHDEFVRFHALQSIAFGVSVIGAYVVLGVFIAFVSFVPVMGDLFGLLFGLLYPVIGLAAFAGWAVLIYKAYQGERFALPVIGAFADSR